MEPFWEEYYKYAFSWTSCDPWVYNYYKEVYCDKLSDGKTQYYMDRKDQYDHPELGAFYLRRDAYMMRDGSRQGLGTGNTVQNNVFVRQETQFPWWPYTFCFETDCSGGETSVACDMHANNATTWVWVIDQDCRDMIDYDLYHFDWFVFKLKVEDFDRNVDEIPEDAAFFGSQGIWLDTDADGVPDSNPQADEILRAIAVDEYGFIYVAGNTNSEKFGVPTGPTA